MVARPSNAETLSIISQQHHGSGQEVFLTPPRPHASHRLSRPASGLLPEIAVSDDETTSTPRPSTVAETKQESNGPQEQHEGEQAVGLQGHNGDEQISISETARASGEATQAGQNAEAGAKSQAVVTANEGEDLNAQAGETVEVGEKSHEGDETPEGKDSQGNGFETQADGAAQADKISHDVETVNEGGDQHENGMNAQAGDDSTKADEKPEEGGTTNEIDTQAHSGE